MMTPSAQALVAEFDAAAKAAQHAEAELRKRLTEELARIGRDFEREKSFATIECGKWVGAARAAFAGVVAGANEELERRPKLLNDDAFGAGWMLTVRTEDASWRDRLITGPTIGRAFEDWLAAETYKGRSD
jgi:glycine cleavage system H protein